MKFSMPYACLDWISAHSFSQNYFVVLRASLKNTQQFSTGGSLFFEQTYHLCTPRYYCDTSEHKIKNVQGSSLLGVNWASLGTGGPASELRARTWHIWNLTDIPVGSRQWCGKKQNRSNVEGLILNVVRMKTMEPCGKALPAPTASDTGKPGSVSSVQAPCWSHSCWWTL